MGGGLLAAASALRSVLPLFGPPEQKSSSSPLLERVTTRVRRSSVAPQAHPYRVGLFVPAEGGTRVSFVMALRMPVFFVHFGFWGLNMYVISARVAEPSELFQLKCPSRTLKGSNTLKQE
jgi:hypothetical protein